MAKRTEIAETMFLQIGHKRYQVASLQAASEFLERAIAKLEAAAEGQACDRQLRLSLLKIQMETLIRGLRTEGERE